ncbi:MAG: hypothetical protein WC858_04210 [Parcubacteria group bacterium]|jgi:hypothetical protein
MKIIIDNPKTSVANFFRRAGYHFQKNEGDEMAFIRQLTDQPFPRLHLFCKIVDYKFQINIHIDHKRTSYEGTSMHSGEYGEDNDLLSAEVERLKRNG